LVLQWNQSEPRRRRGGQAGQLTRLPMNPNQWRKVNKESMEKSLKSSVLNKKELYVESQRGFFMDCTRKDVPGSSAEKAAKGSATCRARVRSKTQKTLNPGA